MGTHTQRWGPNRGSDPLAYAYNQRYGFGAPIFSAPSGMSQQTKDALTFVGTGVIGGLIARNVARTAVSMLLGGSLGIMAAAFIIAHPKSST